MTVNLKAKNIHLLSVGSLDIIWSRSKRPRFFHKLKTPMLNLWDAGPIRIVWFKFRRRS